MPPEHLWEDAEGLEQWWGTVEEKREAQYGGGSSGATDRDSPPEMTDNDLARAFKQD